MIARALRALAAPLLALLLACCASSPAPAPGTPTIAAPYAYLVEGATPGDSAHPLQPTTAMTYRRQDFGGYQDADAYYLADGTVALDWSYPPFGPFAVGNGDGGEHYVLNGAEVDIVSTQDGSQPGVVQQFTGWVAFRNDATASPNCFTAPIGAWTCYYRQTVTFPALGALDTIVSEHYNTANAATAGAMERSFWALGYGRLVWQSWQRGASPVDPTRCPDFGFNAPPQTGLVLSDCRENVTIVAQASGLTPAQLWQP